MKIYKNFVVVSDYNWLPENIEDSWVHKYTDNYLIYDKFHRFEETEKVKHQQNTAQNIYDMFDFIITHYENLPECTLFCRACSMWPKDTGTPRLDENGDRLSNGTISWDKFHELMNNTTFTELHDFGPEVHNGHSSRVGPDGSFLEINNSWFAHYGTRKYYHNTNTFLQDMYVNPDIPEYIRFSPGAAYIIPKDNILKYSKKFYERIREILSHDVIVTEAHILERCIYTIFTCDYEVQEKYK
tara:strand:+ start:2911 stop:3636 length:726 start_codon:yes stop_codon:yes gene_type:complete